MELSCDKIMNSNTNTYHHISVESCKKRDIQANAIHFIPTSFTHVGMVSDYRRSGVVPSELEVGMVSEVGASLMVKPSQHRPT